MFRRENDEAGQSSDASTQTADPELPQLDLEAQASEAERVQLLPIIVEEYENNQKIAAAKMALAAANRRNLTLEFYEERTAFHYRGSNRGRKVTDDDYETAETGLLQSSVVIGVGRETAI